MLGLLFNPKGMIGTRQLYMGGLTLLALAVLLGLLPLVIDDFQLVQRISLINYVFMYCWVILWIKRYRGAGKPGVMCLIPIGVYLLLAIVGFFLVFGKEFMAMMEVAMQTPNDQDAINAAMGVGTASTTIKGIVFGMITCLIVLFGFGTLIKGEPEDQTVETFS